jgi:hypothetical protein
VKRFPQTVRWLLFAAAIGAWPWISACLDARDAEVCFRDNCKGGRDTYAAYSTYEWAERFGGHAGLQRLRLLSQDPSIDPGGRWTAAEVHRYVDDGVYLRVLKSTERSSHLPAAPIDWLYLHYLHARESIYTFVSAD